MSLFKNKVDSKIIDLYKNNKFDILQFLLQNNLINNITFTDENGNTILHHIVINKDYKYLQYILNYVKKTGNSSVIDYQNNNGDTPLHLAVKLNDQVIATMLNKAGASTSIPNNKSYVVKDTNKKHIFQSIYDSLFKDTSTTSSDSFPSTLQDVDSINENNVVKDKSDPNFDVYEMFIPQTSVNNELNTFIKNLTEKMDKQVTIIGGSREDEVTKIHDIVIKKIMKFLNVQEVDARGYKAIIYKFVKDKFPDLKSLDRAKKMEELTTKDFFEDYKQKHPEEVANVLKIVAERYIEKINRPKTDTKTDTKAKAKTDTAKAKTDTAKTKTAKAKTTKSKTDSSATATVKTKKSKK